MKIEITKPMYGYKGFQNVYLVKGIAKRAIRVILTCISSHEITLEQLVIDAAKYASKRGWKTILIEKDCLYGIYAWGFNLDQSRCAYDRGYPTNSYVVLGVIKHE